MGGHIVVRTGSLLLAFVIAGAVLARVGDDSLGAHQIAFQVFIFLALGPRRDRDRRPGPRRPDARRRRRRPARWPPPGACSGGRWSAAASIGLGLLATRDVLPHAFTSDPAVLDRAHELWPLFALMLPAGALVFALDGILLGAGDTRYLAYAMASARWPSSCRSRC